MSKFLITSALPYINGVKHLGNLAGSMLPADVYARFRRQTATRSCSSAPPTSTARRPSWRRRPPACRSPTTAPASTRCRPTSVAASACRSTTSRAPRARPTGGSRRTSSAASTRRASSRSARSSRSTRRRRPLPARPLRRRHLPALRLPQRARRPVRELHPLLDPADLSIAALGDLGRDRPRGPRDPAPLPASSRPSTTGCATGSRPDATGRRSSARSRSNGSTRACRTAASPATSTGACRCPSRASRTRSSTSGSTRRSTTSAPRSNGARRRPGRDWRDWWQSGDDVTLHAVHGQGQRALPHRELPRDAAGIGPAVEARRHHQGLQLADLRRRQVLHQRRPRHLHGPGARPAAGRLLALVAGRQRAGDGRLRLHPGSASSTA